MQEYITIKGAREHNLKNIDVTIPRDKITVITGPSGSGKSSLAIDTIYAEGQRRYVESLSAYARQFLEQMQKPELDYIDGLSPSIAIDQKTVTKSPRSTVGTITEIYDYMRVLYTRIGIPFCYQCGSIISTQDINNIIISVSSLPERTRIQVLAPCVRGRKGEYKKELQQMRMDGFVRARIDGKMVELTQDISLKKQQRHTIEIVIDRFIIKHGIERQIRHAIDTSMRYADTVIINLIDENRDILFSRTLACPNCGISYPEIEPRLFSFNSKYGACPRCNGMGFKGISDEEYSEDIYEKELTHLSPCKYCSGMRLRKEALSVKINNTNIGEFSGMSVEEAANYVNSLNLSEREMIISKRVLKEVKDRLSFLEKVGLGYLTLDRPSLTLSGGEAQRIRLATQLGSSFTGVLYVLDEPSIGLHPKDCGKLLKNLAAIRDSGNTVIIVEHDEETIRWSDYILDMGPGAGKNGGWVIAAGTPEEVENSEQSITGKYLSGKLKIPVPDKRRAPKDFLTIEGASEFNLKNIDVSIPLETFVCITGVSGSGKSTLIFEILYKTLAKQLYNSNVIPGKYKQIKGLKKIDKVICVDQTPLGRTPRSNPATYTGIFSFIRDLFSQLPDSKVRGYKASRFSFNLSGGRCETCQGDGLKKIEMHFLPDVYVTCDVCNGKRYNKETLDIYYKGRNIADVLEIEAQRLRLSKELGKKATGNTLYILDEPTTGLHFVDVQRLLNVINRLVDLGNSVIVIEHDIDIIKSADYIIDLGPEGGNDGGRIIATGTPEEVAKNKESYTGKYLARKIHG
ncbi:MAG: ABC-ATPase UvrA [Nitrospirae bacterium]|nr:ABC-ATPase UvrA [Nitrospirota bacterium]